MSLRVLATTLAFMVSFDLLFCDGREGRENSSFYLLHCENDFWGSFLHCAIARTPQIAVTKRASLCRT
jgi:hypothetical protein